MEIIKETNGWKLVKKDDSLYIVTPENYEEKYPVVSLDQATDWFDRSVEKGWIYLTRTYYTASVVNGEITTSKHENRSVRSDKVEQWESGKFITKEAAREAIKVVLPKAKEKFLVCQDKLRGLCAEMGFDVGFNYDGDSYGIYNEYEYISFNMNGFDFQFPIN